MKTKPIINSYQDLLDYEKSIALKVDLELSSFKNEFQLLKEDLNPTTLAFKSVSKLMSNDKSAGIVNNFVGDSVNFLLKKVLLRNSGLLTRIAVPLLAKAPITNMLTNLLKNNAPGWINNLTNKITQKTKQEK
ncbi:hypothetical protein [Polluticaenibacter yanchengensis]|uniref:Uncharacterized protein n=1 Tax=Polluticaenibacter yanchengensis TaxID=3014562 RepID=A0ABT4UHR7_9BACT|nr:hypothetical protein [Chitinophagaceae bacterium LY-5]